jgi:ComF family protein
MNTQLLINPKHTLDAEMTKKITQKFNIWKNDFLHLLYPRYCIICNMDTPQIQATICPVCSNELHYSNYENYLEATPLDKIFWGRTHVHHTYALLLFGKGSATQKILHTLKYKDRADLAKYMGSEIGRRIEHMTSFQDLEALIPVPLHPKKEFIRGYNQAEKIAAGIADILNIPVNTQLIKRAVFTESQTKKGRLSRWDNVQDRFESYRNKGKAFKHIALIDDVVTTGATIETCIQILRKQFPDVQISILTIAVAQ